MNGFRMIVVLSVAALATACASPGATSGATASPGMTPMKMGSSGSMAAMDPRMKSMQEMHQKMMNAKTPADRQALMADHMKAMQGGMAMMKGIHGAGGMGAMGSASGAAPMTGMAMCDSKGMPADMAKHQQMMANHMAMMQMMMDMMADRMAPGATTK